METYNTSIEQAASVVHWVEYIIWQASMHICTFKSQSKRVLLPEVELHTVTSAIYYPIGLLIPIPTKVKKSSPTFHHVLCWLVQGHSCSVLLSF